MFELIKTYEMKLKLNLGCGKKIFNNNKNTKWINLDRVKLDCVDIIHDIDKIPYPFKDNMFDGVYCSQVLPYTDKLFQVMEEIYRITKNKGIIKIICPYFASSSAFSTPENKQFFTLRTFNFFSKDNFNNNHMTKARFKVIKKKLKFTREPRWFSSIIEYPVNKFQNIYERLFCFIIPFHEIEYELEVEK